MANAGMISGVGSGALAGAAVGGAPGAAIGAGIGLLGGILQDEASSDYAAASQSIAQAQMQQMQQYLNWALSNGLIETDLATQLSDQSMMMGLWALDSQIEGQNTAVAMAQPTAEELYASYQQMDYANMNLEMQLSGISRNLDLLDSVDPALKEAGTQAYKLLRGEEAAVLGPLRAERERQRASLESELRMRLGTGYKTTSAGMEALNRFDQQTAEATATAQQNSLQMLLGNINNVSSTRGNIGGQAAQAFGSSSNIMQGAQASFGNLINRQLNAYTGNKPDYWNLPEVGLKNNASELGATQNYLNLGASAFANQAPYAGAGFVGDKINAANSMNTFGQLINMGAGVGGSYLGGIASVNGYNSAQLNNSGFVPYPSSSGFQYNSQNFGALT